MIIDFHCHVGEDIKNEKFLRLDYEGLKESMDKWGIDKSVVFPLNVGDDKLIEKSLEILNKSKEEDWIIPFLRINPKIVLREELIELLDRGFKGLKLHSRSQNFEPDSNEYFWIYETCEKKNIPILFHTSVKEDISHPKRIIKIAEKFPGLKIIIAHYFGGDTGLIEEIDKYPNIYVDTSLHLGSMSRFLAVRDKGFKNLLFASDAPYDSQGVALLKIREAGLSEEDEKMVLGGNAVEVLGLE